MASFGFVTIMLMINPVAMRSVPFVQWKSLPWLISPTMIC